MRVLSVLVLAGAALLSACATPIPLNNIAYSGTVGIATSKTAKVTVVTGATRGSRESMLIPIGTVFMPIASGPVPKLMFHAEDQQAFGDSLKTELARLGLVRKALDATASSDADLSIAIYFAQTYHNSYQQEYVLDVAMELTGGPASFLRQYRVISSEKDSTLEKWNTNAYEAKVKGVKRLMERLIPDIEKYLAASEAAAPLAKPAAGSI